MSKTVTDLNWESVAEYLRTAKAIAWDECHKIYVLMDNGQVHLMAGYGYNPLITNMSMTPDEMLDTVKNWYDQSCSLRFVEAVESVREGENPNDGFTELIPQFFAE